MPIEEFMNYFETLSDHGGARSEFNVTFYNNPQDNKSTRSKKSRGSSRRDLHIPRSRSKTPKATRLKR